MINLNYLRYFYICAQCESFTKAASKLRISQPSLSVQIKTFEEQLGFHLFVRSGRSINLTPKGQSLFLYASKVFEVTDEMENFLKKNEPMVGHTLKIGVSDEVERPFVAEIVGRLIRANSSRNLMPSIISSKHDEMAELVSSEEIDLIITNEKVSNLKLVSVATIPVVLVSSQLIPNSKAQLLSLNNLFKMLEQGLIMPTEKMILAKETKSFLREKELKLQPVLTSNIIACISRAVLEKLGAAFLPSIYVQKELKNGVLTAYGPKAGYWQHHLYLYTYKGNINPFVDSLSKIIQDFNAMKFEMNLQEMTL